MIKPPLLPVIRNRNNSQSPSHFIQNPCPIRDLHLPKVFKPTSSHLKPNLNLILSSFGLYRTNDLVKLSKFRDFVVKTAGSVKFLYFQNSLYKSYR